MKYFDWDEAKNRKLREEREICFEDVVVAVDEGRVLDILYHPNSSRYQHQLVLVIEISQYVYLVPLVEDDNKVFFKTIFPSRKMTKKYLIKKEK